MTRRGLILFAVMAVIWGIPYLFIRVAVEEISPAALVFARTGLGAAILLPIAILRTDYRAVLARWRWVAWAQSWPRGRRAPGAVTVTTSDNEPGGPWPASLNQGH